MMWSENCPWIFCFIHAHTLDIYRTGRLDESRTKQYCTGYVAQQVLTVMMQDKHAYS